MNKQNGLLVVISGPSGVGKGTVCNILFERKQNICSSISVTTRSPRSGEQEGVHYYFLTRQEFFEKRANGDFLEWAEVYGNFYGTLRSEVDRLINDGKNVILEIDTQGALQIKRECPWAISVFLLPPKLDELKRRITSRGTESQQVIELRLAKAESEIALANQYDYQVVNDDAQQAAEKILQIIIQETAKLAKGN